MADSEWIRVDLANGEYVDWTRCAGWMCTCPVLILFLVSMTTFGGREASVRVVPLCAASEARTSDCQPVRVRHWAKSAMQTLAQCKADPGQLCSPRAMQSSTRADAPLARRLVANQVMFLAGVTSAVHDLR